MTQWIRPRRLRSSVRMRELAAETRLDAQDLIQGYFVLPGEGHQEPIAALPGIERQSVDVLLDCVGKDYDLGIRNVLLFGVPEPDLRDPVGSSAYEGEPLVARAVRSLKKAFGSDLLVITDVCLCAYTSHGHCGQLGEHGEVDNDATLPLLAKMALCHAEAGADIVAPSDMMDGRVAVIRETLDEAGYSGTAILSYAAKFASAFYGPFREAAGSAPGHGDRKGYQADPRAGRAAVRDALLDEAEGADLLMVKPALAYLDIIAALRAETLLPLVCYNVSGEYAMLKMAAREGLLDLRAAVLEAFIAMKRAGADRIITYHAREALAEGWLS
jgi:porphobilinogen synthase